MIEKIEELIKLGFQFECGAHINDVGYYALFERRTTREPEDYCRAETLAEAIEEAYGQAKGWLGEPVS